MSLANVAQPRDWPDRTPVINEGPFRGPRIFTVTLWAEPHPFSLPLRRTWSGCIGYTGSTGFGPVGWAEL